MASVTNISTATASPVASLLAAIALGFAPVIALVVGVAL